MLEKLIWHYWINHSVINVTDIVPNVAIVTDDPGWHGRQLREALAAHGLSSQYVSSMDCHMDIGESGTEINLPGFNTLPLAVFVRGVPGGSLEQVIFRLNILHALSEMGIVVYNNPRGIERTVDSCWNLLSATGETYGAFQGVIVATPAPRAAELLSDRSDGCLRILILPPLRSDTDGRRRCLQPWV